MQIVCKFTKLSLTSQPTTEEKKMLDIIYMDIMTQTRVIMELYG